MRICKRSFKNLALLMAIAVVSLLPTLALGAQPSGAPAAQADRGAEIAGPGAWELAFREKLAEATKLAGKGGLNRRRLYDLGRTYIRKKLEEQLQNIERNKLNTSSDVIVLMAVYNFFNYTSPLGFALDDNAPGFEADLPYNEPLSIRWKTISDQAFLEAVQMYDYGEKIYGDQIYELGRSVFLAKTHSRLPTMDDQDISPPQWKIMRSVFRLISYLNSPGGPDLTYAPNIAKKENGLKPRDAEWESLKRVLLANKGTIGIGDGLTAFLVGSPSSWRVFSQRLAGAADKSMRVIALASELNTLMTKVAACSTDAQNGQAVKADQTSLYRNYATGDDFASYLPPSIRIQIIKYLGTTSGLSPENIVNLMQGFKDNGRTYGLVGWQGIAKRYLSQRAQGSSGGKNQAATLEDFADHLEGQHVLLQKAALGSRKDNPLEKYLSTAEGERQLGEIFSGISVFYHF